MAIVTVNEKHAVVYLANWTIPAVPISSDGIGTDDQKQILHGYPTQNYTGVLAQPGMFYPIIARRRGRR